MLHEELYYNALSAQHPSRDSLHYCAAKQPELVVVTAGSVRMERGRIASNGHRNQTMQQLTVDPHDCVDRSSKTIQPPPHEFIVRSS